MLFTHPNFIFIFLPGILILHGLASDRQRNILLTVASVLFYAAGERGFVPWMIASIAVNHWVAKNIERLRGTEQAKSYLFVGVVVDLSLLLVFKYSGFILDNANSVLLPTLGLAPFSNPHVVLPLGISFFTFHKLSYKIDVYRGVSKFKRNPLDLTLYIMFFPQLIAGPIVRYREMADQLDRRWVTLAGFSRGVLRFVVGLGKKMIIANPLGFVADQVFELPAGLLLPSAAWFGILCYSLQIYFDFSGYSDMALGLARMFGFRFPENFDYPYVSRSVTEFWRRWHMSLSRWFRDYLYIPLGGNRGSPARTYLNLVLVFFLCGLWHGASWNFVFWGLLHGAFLVIERASVLRFLQRCPELVQRAYTLLAVTGGWVLFRSVDLGQARDFFLALIGGTNAGDTGIGAAAFSNPEVVTLVIVGTVLSTPVVRRLTLCWVRSRRTVPLSWRVWHEFVGASMYATVMVTTLAYSLILISSGSYNPFIYFRF